MITRLTWTQIQEKYPDQWLGLTDVKYEPDNNATIESAIVTYTNRTSEELLMMQIDSDGDIICVYTTPDDGFCVGVVEVL